jgi:ketosteroid isomerase-like protein
MRRAVFGFVAFGLAGAASVAGGPDAFVRKENSAMGTASEAWDRKQIVEHIHGLFQAYIRKDREAIRRGHTEDWRGFQVRSDHIVRGIDEYMVAADKILSTLNGKRYEIVDSDVNLYGDIAVVYYTAKYWFLDVDGREQLMPLRSVDIYRREKAGWNQCGSNICLMPPNDALASDADAPVSRPLSESDRRQLLADREVVWRACFANDRAALRHLLPPDIIAINAGDGAWQTDRGQVPQFLTEFAADGAKLVRLEFPRTEFQAIGETVILYTTYEFEMEKDGKRRTQSGRATEVFVRRGGRWINPGWHLDSGD